MLTYSHRHLWWALALLLAAPLWAQPNPNGGNQNPPPPFIGGGIMQPAPQALALGQADVVVLATVTDIQLPAQGDGAVGAQAIAGNWAPVTYAANGRGGPAMATVTLRIDKALAGKFKAGDTVTLPVQVMPMFAVEDGKAVVKGWRPNLQPKDQRLLALQRGRDGYSFPQGEQSVQPADNLPAWENALATLPVKVSLQAKGILAFDQPAPVTVTLKNQTDKLQPVANIAFSGYYVGKKMDAYIQFFPAAPPADVKADALPNFQQPLLLAPNEEKTLTLYVIVHKPQAWQLFDADSCLITPAAMRALVMVLNEAGNLQKGMTMLNSPVGYIYVGFPLPDKE